MTTTLADLERTVLLHKKSLKPEHLPIVAYRLEHLYR
jgi:hypothetical protein